MKSYKLLAFITLLALLLVPAAVMAQEQAAPERGVIEFGARYVDGTVDGRTQPGTVPFANGFRPDLRNSGLNTYNDIRNAFYVPKFEIQSDSLFGSKTYFHLQSTDNGFAFENGGSLSRNLSALLTVGQYGHYKVQFRFDETPHIFSGTTQTIFSSNGVGGWNVNPAIQNKLFSTLCGTVTATGACSVSASVTTISNTLNSLVAGTLVAGAPGAQLFTQQESRKAGTGTLSWNITPDFNLSGLFSREHQLGTRPIGFIMGNSSSGYMSEAPETLDYYTDNFKVAGEYGKKSWDVLGGYQGSFFTNNVPNMVVMNPFSNVYNQVTATMSSTVGPASGRMDLYPDNHYNQFIGQGAVDLGKNVHFMASVTPGWLTQNQAFQPLTTNTSLNLTAPSGYPAFLPASNLGGKVDTLAMNYTGVFKARKNLVFTAKFYYYDYNNQTPDLLVRPTVADTSFLISNSFHGSTANCYDPVAGPGSVNVINTNYTYYCPAEQSSFTSKTFDVGGNWFFGKKNSLKFGFQRGWMDRTHREVAEMVENSFYSALDMHLSKTVMLRVSGRHQNRVPQGGLEAYEVDPSNVYARMPDQSTRIRNRGDVSLTWDATQRLSLSGFWGTLQDNYNVRSSVNSLVPLGDTTYSKAAIAGTVATPIYGPYFAYGLLSNVGRNYGFDVNYALSKNVVLYAEYGHELNTGIILQGRNLNAANCFPTGSGFLYPSACDPINDFITAPKDKTNSFYWGADFNVTKKVDISAYYGLTAAQSYVHSDGVNCQIGTNGPNSFCRTHWSNWSLDSASSQAVTWSYPENVNRVHEVGTIARFKLTDRVIPKFQYIYRRYDNTDWQTGVINPYSFVGIGSDPGGTSALQKMLLLGADQPSYKAHIFSATLEYHF